MKNLKKIVSVLFSAIRLFSATTTSSVAIDKLHFVIGGGAGGGWDGTARGTGEALTKAGMLSSASFENMSGGGGGKALAYMINTKPANTVLVQSTPYGSSAASDVYKRQVVLEVVGMELLEVLEKL